MRILMIARSTLYSAPGGDTTQVEMTAEYLKFLGINVELRLSDDDNINYTAFDLVHFFNIFRPADILPHLFKLQIPFVVSTIFVDYFEYDKKSRKGFAGLFCRILNRNQIEFFKSIARSFKNGEKIKSRFYVIMGQKKSIKLIARQAAVLLPNSHNEYKRLNKIYKVDKQYIKVVNAIDPRVFNEKVVPDSRFAGHVLCIGRIEGLKNQLNLIKALSATSLNLTIIGKPSPNHIQYYNKCIELATKFNNIRFINHVDHKELPAIYKAAKVHVLPSWFETTGLSSLEAGAMGCNLVITRKGDVEEYFSDMAFYCEPDDIVSIREAVLKAYNAPFNRKLQDHILNNNTWEKTAEQTSNAYKLVLEN